MLKRNATVVAFGLLLAAMLVLPVTARSQGGPPTGAPPPGAPSGPMMHGPGGMGMANEPHPAIRRAKRMLEHTKMILGKDAAKDFGGHKAEAVKNIDEAIKHLDMALAADKK